MNRRLLPALLLAALVVLIYAQAGGHDFLVCDDDRYVYDNARVRGGLTADGVAWAFSSTETYNWHPLTWISHMADVSLFGLAPGPHHLVNVFLHAANAILLFLLLARLTGASWRSFFAAALFAVHPLHVEPVAWIAERKELLCACFFLLSLLAYERYARHGGTARYLAVVILFVLSLLSKPMSVTLPFVLLLLDHWPLGRLALPETDRLPVRRLLVEKIPFFLLSAAACLVTLLAQREGGSVVPLETIPFPWRVANALVSCATYLSQTLWPASLGVYYPHPGRNLPAWQVVASILLLASVSWAVFRERCRRPWLSTGWLWYLVMLLPVVGLIQVGGQARADRYTYLPLVGIFIAVSWLAADLSSGRSYKRMLPWAGGLMVAALAATSWRQAGYWKDSVTLFSRAVEVAGENRFASFNLGFAYEKRGRLAEAMAQYREVLRLAPDDEETLYKMGVLHGRTGRLGEAVAFFRDAARVRPSDARAWRGLALALSETGRPEEAVAAYREAARLEPGNAATWNNLGAALEKLGRRQDAADAWRQALRIDPAYAKARDNLERASRKPP
jgi:Flp pilus assembly protein TadD